MSRTEGTEAWARVIGSVSGGLFGAAMFVVRAADEWSQITIELVIGAVFLALGMLVTVTARLGGSSMVGAVSSAVAFAAIGTAWSSVHRDGMQLGLNVAMGMATGVAFAFGVACERYVDRRKAR